MEYELPADRDTGGQLAQRLVSKSSTLIRDAPSTLCWQDCRECRSIVPLPDTYETLNYTLKLTCLLLNCRRTTELSSEPAVAE